MPNWSDRLRELADLLDAGFLKNGAHVIRLLRKLLSEMGDHYPAWRENEEERHG